MFARIVLIAGVVAVLGWALAAPAIAQSQELELVEPEEISLAFSDGKTDEVSVWLKNKSTEERIPTFGAVLQDDDGKEVLATVTVTVNGKDAAPAPLATGAIARYRLYLDEASESSGQLVAGADGVAPASLPVSLNPETSVARGVNGALVIPFGLALIVLLAAWYYGHGTVGLGDTLRGTPELDFTKSFASTLTAAGALLGTIISAGVLPEETVSLSKAGFTGLNLTFGIAVVIAAVISSVQKPKSEPKKDDKTKREWKFESYVFTFLAAALITLWAVFGELWTLWRLVEELGRDDGFTSLGVTVMQVLIFVAGVAMIPYTFAKLKGAVLAAEEIAPPVAKKPGFAPAAQPAPPPPVRLL